MEKIKESFGGTSSQYKSKIKTLYPDTLQKELLYILTTLTYYFNYGASYNIIS